jgi:ribosomal protein S18 acetylase RimI-like enzyme
MEHEGFDLGLAGDLGALEAVAPEAVDLMAAAFVWELTATRFMEIFMTDPRLAKGPHAVTATDRTGQLAGFLGLARRPYCHNGEIVRTGHIWVFAVRQDASRRGLGRALFKLAMDTYRSEGLEGVTLCTQTGLVAVELYRQQGFKVHHRYGLWRAPPLSGDVMPTGLRPLDADEVHTLADVYNRNLEGCEGWSVHEGDVIELRRVAGSISPDWYLTPDPPGALEGYVCVAPAPVRGITYALEVVGPDEEWYVDALESLRARPGAEHVALKHYNPVAKEALAEAGYTWHDYQSRECMMYEGEPLTPDPELVAGGPGLYTESRHDIF